MGKVLCGIELRSHVGLRIQGANTSKTAEYAGHLHDMVNAFPCIFFDRTQGAHIGLRLGERNNMAA
ncbi:MAG: hypothetical protein JWQ87_3866 [Candidatus Sulfotelmatobacter sp.]|nr:hypothetical protein [Candidatus Sulfotelmatobacter sp.]